MSLSKKIESTYEKKKQAFVKIFETGIDYQYTFTKNNNNEHIIELTHDGKLCLRAIYSIIGNYNLFNSVWYWAYNIALIDKDLASDSLLIKKYDVPVNEDEYTDGVHYMCGNPNFFISNDNMNMVIKLALFVTDFVFYLPLRYDESDKVVNADSNSVKRVEYVFIKKVLNIS